MPTMRTHFSGASMLPVLLALMACAACVRNPALTVAVSSGTQFAVAGDSQQTLYIDLQGILWRLPADGSNAIPLSTALSDIRRPHLSPDGQTLIFESFSNGYWHIGAMAPDGSARQVLTSGSHDNREPAWSADASRIVFSSDRSGNEDIWLLRLADGALMQLSNDPAADYAPALAANRLVFVSERNGKTALYSLPLGANGLPAAQSVPTELAAAPAGKIYPPRFSPDGSQLAWVQAARRNAFPGVAQNELVIMDIVSSELRTLSTPQSDVFSAPPAWIDNQSLLYTADGQIRKLDLARGTASTVPFQAALELKRHHLTPKQPLTFTTTEQPVLGIVDPVMLADDSIVFTALGDLWQLSSEGALKQITNDAWVERDAAVSPDGRLLAYISDRGGSMQIWLRDLGSGSDRQLTDQSAGPRYPAFSPNGKALAYQQTGPRGTQDFTVHVLDIASGTSKRLRSAPAVWPGRMAWSAAGSHLTIAELFIPAPRFGDGANRLMRIDVVNDVATVESLPADMVPDAGPAGSPDGARLALVIDGALWLAPTAADGSLAGQPQLLLDELVESPAWSADSRQLTVLTQRGLESIAVDSSQRRLRNPPLAWSPATQPGTRIVHASRVFDGIGDNYLYDMDIVIEDARIVRVEAHRPHPQGVEIIDATDRTVIPGLIDHHVHFEGHEGERTGRSFLAFGVTTVVEPGGLPYESREIMEAWASGRRTGPRLVYAGPQLDGERRTFYFGTHVRSERRLDWELQRAQRLAYGFLKTYRRLPPRLQEQAVQDGHAQGLPVTAHAAFRNLGFGGDRSEHLRGSSRLAYSSKQSDLLQSYGDILAIFAATEGALTPTLVNQGAFFDYVLRHPEVMDNRQFKALYSATDRQALVAFARIVGKNIDFIRAGLGNAQATLAQLHAGGARIVAGTDSPIFPYGLALVMELESYVGAGLTTAAALRTATSDAAREMGAAGTVGTVSDGTLADLVIINGDPLTNINDLLNVTGVLKNGQYYPADALLENPK